MHDGKAHGKHLFRNEQMADVGSGIAAADGTITLRIDGTFVQHILGILQIDGAFPGKEPCVPGVSGRHDTIEEVNTTGNRLDNIARSTHAHEVAGLLLGHMRLHGIDDIAHLFRGLAHRKATDGIAGQIHIGNALHVIYTDIVYYSDADITELRAKLFEEEVDGVYISNRMSLHDDVKNIIDDQIKRDFDAINMRGFILDALSQMEGLLRDKYAEYFLGLKAEEREQKIRELVGAIKSRQEACLSRVKRMYKDGDVDKLLHCTALVTLDVVRDALKGMVKEGEQIFGQDSEFAKLQKNRNRWAHDSITLSSDGQRVILANDKEKKEGYGREDFKMMRVSLANVESVIENALSQLELK